MERNATPPSTDGPTRRRFALEDRLKRLGFAAGKADAIRQYADAACGLHPEFACPVMVQDLQRSFRNLANRYAADVILAAQRLNDAEAALEAFDG